ncbi:MAG: 3-isopropylmalate dehydratase small subunit [Burkholderiales bacterium]
MAKTFTVLSGVAAPYLESNVSTNNISQQKAHGTGGIEAPETGDDLLATVRFDRDGREIPTFILNHPPFRSAKFLLTGGNFGCGSSREGAIHALVAFGIRCVIAPSFGEIFFNNCFKNGMLPIVLTEQQVLALAAEAETGGIFAADLPANVLTTPSGRRVAIALPAFRRQQLLDGLDEIGLTLQRATDIAAYHADATGKRPWVYSMQL